jgi:hypothetical protein
MFKTFKERITLLLIIFILIFFVARTFEFKSDYDRISKNMTAVNMKLQKFKEITQKDSTKIASQQQIVLTQKEALANNLLEIEDLKEYKRIKSKVNVVTVTKIDTVFIPYDEVAYDTDSTSIPLPEFKRSFNYTEKENWFKLNGNVSNLGVSFNEISIRNKYSILIADKKMGLFKRNEPIVVLKNDNPYTSTVKMNNVQIDYKKAFYKKNGFWFALGTVAGILIVK